MVGFSQFNVYQREHFAIRIQGHDHNHCSEDEESTVSKIQPCLSISTEHVVDLNIFSEIVYCYLQSKLA